MARNFLRYLMVRWIEPVDPTVRRIGSLSGSTDIDVLVVFLCGRVDVLDKHCRELRVFADCEAPCLDCRNYLIETLSKGATEIL